MIKKNIIKVVACLAVFSSAVFAKGTKPNVVYILCDDLGYGDVQCLSPKLGKIKTPHMDQLAAQGMVFTDAHTTSSVCTPSRYGVLTGRYNWRTELQKHVLYGYGQPLIAPDRMTVAGFLKGQGYNTAAIGKWHLGLELSSTDDKPANNRAGNIDWNGVIQGGPVSHGFDYFYGISASLDMDPYIYIENDRFLGECTTVKAFPRKGLAHADFEAVDVLPAIANKTVEFIAKQSAETPFFVYVPLTSPHTPILPLEEWVGKSGLGRYGDFVMQTDAAIGRMIAAVESSGLAENTIIIVTSDNGCSRAAGIQKLEAQGHFPSAHLRGSKADLWDGGHRVPFIVRWPASVKAGSQSDQTICLTDLISTCADIVGANLPETAGEDSVSFLPALSGQPIATTRQGIVHHSISGHFAYRQGKWKLLLAKGSGGWTSPKEDEVPAGNPKGQLYDMEADPGETTNLYEANPEIVEKLMTQLESDVMSGRSTDGLEAKNDIEEIVLWKATQEKARAKSAAKNLPFKSTTQSEPVPARIDIETTLSVDGFAKLPVLAASGRSVTANQKIGNVALETLVDGQLGQGFGPVFKNGVKDGAYKMDLGSVQSVAAITSWSYRKGNRIGQKVALYGSASEVDPGWDLSAFTLLGMIDETTKATYTAVSLRALEGQVLGDFRWIVWAVSPVTTAAEGGNSSFQELAVEVN